MPSPFQLLSILSTAQLPHPSIARGGSTPISIVSSRFYTNNVWENVFTILHNCHIYPLLEIVHHPYPLSPPGIKSRMFGKNANWKWFLYFHFILERVWIWFKINLLHSWTTLYDAIEIDEREPANLFRKWLYNAFCLLLIICRAVMQMLVHFQMKTIASRKR